MRHFPRDSSHFFYKGLRSLIVVIIIAVASFRDRRDRSKQTVPALVTPKSLTKDQRKLLEQVADIEDTNFADESFMDKVRNIFG